jgi:hypothetical protein
MYWLFLSPASANAFLNAGASKSAQRAEETVSGRMTAMLPLPFATIGFSNFMVVKFALNVLSETVLLAAELTLGTIATTIPPTNATQARALPVLNFIVPQPF